MTSALLCWQESATGPYRKSRQFCPLSLIPLKILFDIPTLLVYLDFCGSQGLILASVTGRKVHLAGRAHSREVGLETSDSHINRVN
jgi:hypothetical protein